MMASYGNLGLSPAGRTRGRDEEDGSLRSVGLWRTVLRRMRADWPVVAAAWLLLLCATTLLTGGTLYGDTVALGGLRSALAQADVAGRSLVVTSEDPASQAVALDSAIRPELERGRRTCRVAWSPAWRRRPPSPMRRPIRRPSPR